MYLNSFVLRLSPVQQLIQKMQLLKFSHPKYVGYTWVIPLKPTASAIQKDSLDKKEEKYDAYRKRPTANYYYYF